MSVDLSAKKADWVRRVVAKVYAAIDAIDEAGPSVAEYSDEAFNGGDQVNRPGNTITDADLVAAGFPQISAAMLNQFFGGFAAITSARAANAGVLDAPRG